MRKILIIVGILLVALLLVLGACTTTSESPPADSTPPTEPTHPTYSQVINTYPPGVELCYTEVTIEKVEPDGSWWIAGTVEVKGGVEQIQCYGTKITLGVSVTLDGENYPAGTKLTVDKDLNWIEVSSWD